MIREKANASEFADMIASKIGANGVEVTVRRDHAYGWQPNVVNAPSDLIGFLRRAEEIANRLRISFELRD